jgi:exodeoxyribonuclease V alpha subunit
MVSENSQTPLILENTHLYLHRYWSYECRLAKRVLQMTSEKLDVPDVIAALDRYFGVASEIPDYQREAAQTAITHPFSIITGGPGTGKTTTVVKILALLQELAEQPLLIALAAPTGKAAMRLQEAINQRKNNLPSPDDVLKQIPETVSTLHRLLGARPPSPYFNYCAERPLPHDLVVVDEASMVDLALMSKLLDALKPGARLILLGDKDQLASVESGAVLADLTKALPECTLELKKSYRFNQDIKQLADAVNQQNAAQAWKILQSDRENVSCLSDDLITFVASRQMGYLKLIKSAAPFQQIYQSFNSFQVLCSNRHGTNGMVPINTQVEHYLRASGDIDKTGEWYAGRPIMITKNNAAMHLYNGDIGICLSDPKSDEKLMVFFPSSDGDVKKLIPTRLPHCETVFAMTIHKSQGSEFNEILIALPPTMNPVLSKELLYTAITRAREKVVMVVEKLVFEQTIQKKTERFGGLEEKIIGCQTKT